MWLPLSPSRGLETGPPPPAPWVPSDEDERLEEWWDATDPSVRFQDLAGLVPAVLLNDPVALLLDKSSHGRNGTQGILTKRPSVLLADGDFAGRDVLSSLADKFLVRPKYPLYGPQLWANVYRRLNLNSTYGYTEGNNNADNSRVSLYLSSVGVGYPAYSWRIDYYGGGPCVMIDGGVVDTQRHSTVCVYTGTDGYNDPGNPGYYEVYLDLAPQDLVQGNIFGVAPNFNATMASSDGTYPVAMRFAESMRFSNPDAPLIDRVLTYIAGKYP